MNCENALELMNRELDEALTAEESAALQAHLDACPDCRETWRQLHELDALLQESELEPPAALHDGVMQAIRQEQKRKPRRAWLPAAAIAAAAALVLLAGKAGLDVLLVWNSGVPAELETTPYEAAQNGARLYCVTGQLAQAILDGYITAAYSPDDVFSDLPEKEAAYVLVLP